MSEVVLHVGRGGSIRAIHDDDYDFLAHGCPPPTRASHVEPIQTGPNAGKWLADMSPLGPGYEYCLWPPHNKRRDALAAEHQHIEEHWL